MKQFLIFDPSALLRTGFGFVIGESRKKSILSLVLCASLFALCLPAAAQQPAKIPRLGYLSNADAATDSAQAEGIRLALRDLGFINGQNIAIEYRYAEGRPDRAPEHAAELVRLKVDIIIVASGDPWIRAAKNATKTIPIVMVGVGSDPVRAGFVESLARPGGNVTGLTALNTELGGKRLELLKEAVPKLSRVAVLYDPATPGLHEVKEFLPADAHALKLTIEPWEIRAVDDFEKVFAALNKQRPDGLYVIIGGGVMRPNQKRIAGFALKSRLPSVSSNEEFVDAGGLISYGADEADSYYKRVAYYVDKILKGAKPADLPVEQPTKFELAINLKTAKQIGVNIPQSLLYRADKVIR